MGNEKVRKMIGVRERARQALAIEAAALAARQKRVEGAVADVWSALEARAARVGKRDTRIAKLQATFDTGRARADEDYETDAAEIRDRYAVAVQQLRTDGKTPAEISELTGLSPAEVRDAQAIELPAADKATESAGKSERARRAEAAPPATAAVPAPTGRSASDPA